MLLSVLRNLTLTFCGSTFPWTVTAEFATRHKATVTSKTRTLFMIVCSSALLVEVEESTPRTLNTHRQCQTQHTAGLRQSRSPCASMRVGSLIVEPLPHPALRCLPLSDTSLREKCGRGCVARKPRRH